VSFYGTQCISVRDGQIVKRTESPKSTLNKIALLLRLLSKMLPDVGSTDSNCKTTGVVRTLFSLVGAVVLRLLTGV